eukprot:CAMPEP_0176288302 /NCGR_PEP_ID=MMETSP0121_2-20121125/53900_1 /TAXON_ID=160619 /ORGANISM="Kryptoperidinium foliaceum, Strain CCMP 1326" /LENGTH=59 /DNA_ID=CAMNT_0017628983 /DNA_START=273 /DNA_END=448 /DNA_ORIENTATION=+
MARQAARRMRLVHASLMGGTAVVLFTISGLIFYWDPKAQWVSVLITSGAIVASTALMQA